MDRIIGQDHAIAVLQRQLAADRLHHAYVFSGPAGVGKFTTAAAFARLLLCHERQQDAAGAAACGACASCQLIDGGSRGKGEGADEDATLAALAGAHPDLHVVTKELARYSDDRQVRERKLTQIPVDVLREHLLAPVQRAARLRHGKVFIVDEAEMLNPTGQNLLLKTLEEPPAGTTIILVTASEDRLLPTIRSRCHRIGFVPLSDEALTAWLATHAPEASERDRAWLLEFAGGSPGRARLALAYGLSEWAEAVLVPLERIVTGQGGGALGHEIAQRIDDFARTWVDRHDNASKEAANKLAAELMGALITARARRRLGELARNVQQDNVPAQETAMEPWLNVIDAVQRMRSLLETNVNLSLVCDHLVTRLAVGDQ